MYDINKRTTFDTVGELKKLIENVPDNTKVYVIGSSGWFHIEEDKTAICFDDTCLEDCYDIE